MVSARYVPRLLWASNTSLNAEHPVQESFMAQEWYTATIQKSEMFMVLPAEYVQSLCFIYFSATVSIWSTDSQAFFKDSTFSSPYAHLP